jgi:hypothetical protein
VFALPGSATRIGAPGASAFASDQFVAPMTATDFSCPFRESARDAFGHKRRYLQFVNRMFRLRAFCGHVQVKSNAYETIRRQFGNMRVLVSPLLGCNVAPDISFNL